MDITITAVDVVDVRFPTSRTLAGSDAMNEAPDYSAAYVTLTTDSDLSGYGMTFTIGRGTEIVCQAVRSLAPLVVGTNLADIRADPGRFWRDVTGDSQLRWIGPEKGAIHLATAALVNAVWDLWARAEGKPLWKLVADMSPEEIVRCVDFRYLTDALTPQRSGGAAGAPRRHARRARGRDAPRRLPRLLDLGRLARLHRRRGPPPLPGGRRRGLEPREDEGRRRPGEATSRAPR